MGRQDGNAAPPGIQYIHMPRQSVYAVGVQYHGLFRFRQQLQYQPGHLLSLSQSRPQGQHMAGL